jgi:hypothetical protein
VVTRGNANICISGDELPLLRESHQIDVVRVLAKSQGSLLVIVFMLGAALPFLGGGAGRCWQATAVGRGERRFLWFKLGFLSFHLKTWDLQSSD